MLEYWCYFGLALLALAVFLTLSDSRQKKNKLKIRRLKRKLAIYEKGADMSKLINDLIGKKCRIQTYGEIKVIDADEEWIKFEYVGKGGKPCIKILRIDELSNIDLLD